MTDVILKVEFGYGAKVQFNNKIGKDEGMVVALKGTIDGGLLYEVSWSDKKQSYHYGAELKLLP